MKILMISPWFPNKINPVSGIYVRDMASAAGVHCQVFVFSSYIDPSQARKRVLNSTYGTVQITQLEYRKLTFPIVSYLLYLYHIVRELNGQITRINPDIIHAHVHTYGFLGILLGKKFGIPVIISEHVQVQFPYTEGMGKRIKHYLHGVTAKFAYSRANKLIVVSNSLRKSIQALGIRNQICIIPNIVDTQLFYLTPGKKRKRNFTKILYVGGLSEIKGVIYLLRAIHSITEQRQDFFLDIIGTGPEMLHLQEFAVQHDLSPCVKFHGRRGREDAAAFMRETDFLVLPSLYETFGIVLIEALACGKPVISTTSGGQSDFITKENGILVPPGEVESLGNAIVQMLDTLSSYSPETISRNATERFSSETIGRALLTAYMDTLNGI